MDVLNLSRVFGPTLVGHSSANPAPLTILEDAPRQCKVVARLLALPSDFWRGFVGSEQEKPGTTPEPSSKCALHSWTDAGWKGKHECSQLKSLLSPLSRAV
uniref:Rho-GAP domain-containing protein n=1 Tax=Coturnix japonica TaxID=93934 RepID=A0A8C2TNL4_COTJA